MVFFDEKTFEKRPDVFEDLYEDTILAGFEKIYSVVSGCWYTDDDDSERKRHSQSHAVSHKSILRCLIAAAPSDRPFFFLL